MKSKYKAPLFSLIVLILLLSPAFLLLRNKSVKVSPKPIVTSAPSFSPTSTTPTCRPRPACLDETPRCLIPETEDMCPPETKPTPAAKDNQSGKSGCLISGCSSEICSEEEMFSTCILKPENECYKTATCEKQENGRCGWTETSDLNSCLEKY